MSETSHKISAESLLAELGFVRALARRLVHDRGLAEDVAQQACVAAIETAPHAVRAHRKGHRYPAAFRRAEIALDGTFAFDGLEAGVWRIGHRRTPLDAYVEVHVREEDVEVSVDVRHVK